MSKIMGSGFTKDDKIILAFDDVASIELTLEEAMAVKEQLDDCIAALTE